MNIFVLKNTFIKSIHISLSDKYFYKKKESKLYFEDCVVVLNDLLCEYGESRFSQHDGMLLVDEVSTSRPVLMVFYHSSMDIKYANVTLY
jgi:hypothetical protein